MRARRKGRLIAVFSCAFSRRVRPSMMPRPIEFCNKKPLYEAGFQRRQDLGYDCCSMPSAPVTLESIRATAERIKGAVYRSPCPYSLGLSRLCGCEIFCKLDHLQLTGSFKERGARNKLMLLGAEEKQRGVIAASAGNHALGLAYHGKLLSIPVTVVMPRWAPLIKVSNCRTLGANILLHGESFDEARAHAHKLAEEKKLVYVNGFDDPDIIAGAGTMGLEILEDVPDADAVIVPIGGAGLISGVGTAIKSL